MHDPLDYPNGKSQLTAAKGLVLLSLGRLTKATPSCTVSIQSRAERALLFGKLTSLSVDVCLLLSGTQQLGK